jgi:tryptophan-rich sensory protein
MAIAAWLVWRRTDWSTGRWALSLFGVQLALNVAWSGFFFGLQWPGVALVELMLLLAAIVATIVVFHRYSRLAAAILVPYLLWTTFAAFLNFGFWQLN